MADPEIEAMSAVAGALGGLEEPAQGRVLRWAAERFGVTLPAKSKQPAAQEYDEDHSDDEHHEQSTAEQEVDGPAMFEHFAELFAATNPRTNEDKALVAAYWAQVIEGNATWQSRRLNAELKHLGHTIPNITDALTSNIRKRPQRVIQLRKSSSAQQANKTYKVTNEGIVYVQGMLSGGNV